MNHHVRPYIMSFAVLLFISVLFVFVAMLLCLWIVSFRLLPILLWRLPHFEQLRQVSV